MRCRQQCVRQSGSDLRAIHSGRAEWAGHAPVTGRWRWLAMSCAPARRRGRLPMLPFGGVGDLDLYEADNRAFDRDGAPLPILGFYVARRDGMPAGAAATAPRRAELRRVSRPRLAGGLARLALRCVDDIVYSRLRPAAVRPRPGRRAHRRRSPPWGRADHRQRGRCRRLIDAGLSSRNLIGRNARP